MMKAADLMIAGAVLGGGGHAMMLPEDGCCRAFDAPDVLERCVALAAAAVGVLGSPTCPGHPEGT